MCGWLASLCICWLTIMTYRPYSVVPENSYRTPCVWHQSSQFEGQNKTISWELDPIFIPSIYWAVQHAIRHLYLLNLWKSIWCFPSYLCLSCFLPWCHWLFACQSNIHIKTNCVFFQTNVKSRNTFSIKERVRYSTLHGLLARWSSWGVNTFGETFQFQVSCHGAVVVGYRFTRCAGICRFFERWGFSPRGVFHYGWVFTVSQHNLMMRTKITTSMSVEAHKEHPLHFPSNLFVFLYTSYF